MMKREKVWRLTNEVLRAAWQQVRAAAAFTASLFDELLLTAALALIVGGLWPSIGRLSLVIPGVVLLWIVLPARSPLVVKAPIVPAPKRRND